MWIHFCTCLMAKYTGLVWGVFFINGYKDPFGVSYDRYT